MKKYFLIILALCFYIALTNSEINSMGFGSISAKPVEKDPEIETHWFIYNLDINERVQDAIVVFNSSEANKEVLIYAADKVDEDTGQDYAIKQKNEKKKNIGAWIKFFPEPIPEEYEKDFEDANQDITKFCKLGIQELKEWCKGTEEVTLELEGKTVIEIPFILSIPNTADIGEHKGGILVQEKTRPTDIQSSGMHLLSRIGIRVYNTVPGDIKKTLKLDNLTADISKDKIYIDIRNEGTISTVFEWEIDIIDDIFGRREALLISNEEKIARNSTSKFSQKWENPTFGIFSIQATLTYMDEQGEEQVLKSEKVTKWVVPWEIIIITASIITIIIIARKFKKDD